MLRNPLRYLPILLASFLLRAVHAEVPENVYRGDLIAFPGAWGFGLPKPGIIIVSDAQIDALTNPDKEVDLGYTGTPNVTTLRKVCEGAKAGGARTLLFAFDYFFVQYQKGQNGKPREYTPDTDAYIERIAKIGAVAKSYGLGLELSLLSPLEIGPGYQKQTGESGLWMHYREGLRDPKTGAFSVDYWRQSQWANNKGVVPIADAGVRVFAFREHTLVDTPYRAVDPKDIIEITGDVKVEVFEGTQSKTGDFRATRVRACGAGHTDIGPLDRVLVVQQYRTPEMDYFSDSAYPYLESLIDKYANAGVVLNGLYSDEMHIQQDWGYHSHHDDGQFALRYVSPGLAKQFAAKFGTEYADFAKYLVYFAYGQETFKNDLSARENSMHVFGGSTQDIRRTALFRAQYYHLLNDGVTDLFARAKRHAEERMGHALDARYHATWAQSPTIDRWRVGQHFMTASQYEYTSNFIWSNTVQQASAACYDYFKWGDFLTGNGNDHTEGGWLDRNYIGLSLACSIGSTNKVPYAYGAHWGMPDAVSRRRTALVNVFGASAEPPFALVEESTHRDVNVLMLYPLDLVAVEERFGSWMSQYAYANTITPAKLLELGRVENGALIVAGRRYTTLAAVFEPFPSEKLLALLKQFVESGGRVVWSGTPPLLTAEGGDALTPWQALAGVQYTTGIEDGVTAPGRIVTFEGSLKSVPPQTILSDFMVDRIYPLNTGGRASSRAAGDPEVVEVIARCGNDIVGALRRTPNGGQFATLAFRPRDDQSKSLGYEMRTWFETLNALGAYPPSGKFPGVNDNTEYLSRTTETLFCRFQNGAIAAAPHLRDTIEQWPGGFIRKAESDDPIVAKLNLPSERLSLKGVHVNGHTVTYEGDGAVAFRVDDKGQLIAFAGRNCNAITIDGVTTTFADAPLPLIAWSPVAEARRFPGGAVFQLVMHGAGRVHIPNAALGGANRFVAEGATPGSRGAAVSSAPENGVMSIEITPASSGRMVYGVLNAP